MLGYNLPTKNTKNLAHSCSFTPLWMSTTSDPQLFSKCFQWPQLKRTCQWDSMTIPISRCLMGKLAIWVFPKNSGFSPQIIHFHRVFPYKPSILGYPHFLETPIWWTRNMDNATCAEPMFAASSSSSSNVEARLAVEDTGSDRFDIAKSRSKSFVESECSQTRYIIQKVSK